MGAIIFAAISLLFSGASLMLATYAIWLVKEERL